MSLKILIGKNKTGKTHHLKTFLNDDMTLYIPAEIDLEDIVKKENLGTNAKPNISPQWRVLNFLNNVLFPQNFKYKFDNEEKLHIENSKKLIDDFNNKISKDKDNYFESCFKEILKIDSINEISTNYNFINKDFKNINISGVSSGSINYSLIKFLYEAILYEKFTLSKKCKLVIDEIEKFSHPEMIFKIADMVTEISKKIDIIVSTHSPLFLEKILFNHKKSIKKGETLEIVYMIATEPKESTIVSIKQEQIHKMLINNNFRELSNISRVLFSSNVFLVEGINDQNLLYNLISYDDKYNNIYYSIIDCNSKTSIKKLYTTLVSMGIENLFNICLFYDKDEDGSLGIKNTKEIMSVPNIEERFFDIENVPIVKNTKTNKIMFKIKDGEKISKNKIEMDEEWIRNNSTKQNIDTEISKIKDEISIFLTLK